MSTPSRVSRMTVPEIAARKGGEPIVCLTAYTAPVARAIDPHVDLILVGDSLGMVLYGFDTTLPVTLDMMIAHGAAVVRASKSALVVVDLPFGSYHESPQQAFRSSVRVLSETGAAAVKLEGGRDMAETIKYLTTRNIPVLAHVGLTPQSVNQTGGYRAKGKNAEEAAAIMADAHGVAAAGAFGVVIEGTWERVAREITLQIPVPTIGIGASRACDGQILVTEDMTGLSSGDFVPKFVKRYADLGKGLSDAAAAYATEVRSRDFPGAEHCYGTGSAEIASVKPGPKTRREQS